MNVLFVADVFGRPGRRVLGRGVSRARDRFRPDLVVVNGENAAGGFGLTPSILDDLLELGVDVVTTGNHVWDKREIYPALDDESRLLRPDNYPDGNPGGGVWTGVVDGASVAVVNLQGRVFMKPIACPFRRIDALLSDGPVAEADVVVVDFHAEATAEKIALGRHLDGRVAAVLGTHTHVPSADARVLERGTAYATDVGMTGPHGGVIGVVAEGSIERFFRQTPNRYTVSKDDVRFQGAIVDVDESAGLARSIERIDWPEDGIA